MWPAAIIALLTAGPFGAVLFIAAGITHFMKVAKVDAEYAKRGETPPTHRLVEKWLDNRKAAGKAPKSAKVAKPGMWAYAWQRWQAMWEDLGDKHKEVRDQYKTAAAQAKARGELPPPKPTFKETVKGWKWHLDQLAPPSGQTDEKQEPGPEASTVPQPTRKPAPRPRAGAVSWPASGTCGKCRQARRLSAVGWCEPCVLGSDHGFCSRCDGLMIRDGDVMRHGPHQGCDAVAPIANRMPARPNPTTENGTTEPVPVPPAQPATTTEQGDTMAQPAAQSGEVTGIPSAVHYMSQVAATHTQHGGNEQVITAMHTMNIGPGDIALVQEAKTASRDAAELWTTAATTIDQHNAGVREGYASAPDAADKHAQTAE